MPKIPELKVYNVYVTVKDPFTAWLVRLPVKTSLLNARGFIEEFKMYHNDIEQEMNEEIKNMFKVRQYKIKKTVKTAMIKHVGIGKNALIYLEIQPLPSILYSAVHHGKYIVYSWLWENAIVIRAKPENMYLLSMKGIRELTEVINKAERYLSGVDSYALTLWESEIKSKIIELVSKYRLVPEDELSQLSYKLMLKHIDKINIKITPIYFGEETIIPIMQRDPEAYQIIMSSFKEYLRNILLDVHIRLKPAVEGLIANRNVRIEKAKAKLEKITNMLKDLGLSNVAEIIKHEYMEIFEDPRRVTNYVSWEELINKINARVLTL